jgi:type II secretory pathway component PulF
MSEANDPRPQAPVATTPIGSVSLADLAALNDEIIALVRAGVPLERGLAGLSGDLPGRFGRVTAALADRMGQGETLATAMASQPQVFPPVYRALVEAGLRCGKLAPVLEGLAGSVRKLRDVRQTILAALLYPLGIVLITLGLFAFMVMVVLPKMPQLYDGHPPGGLAGLLSIGEHLEPWGLLVPIAVVLLFAMWWYRSSRSLVLQTGSGGKFLSGMPGVRSLITNVQAASLADVLALLLEQGIPLHEAVLLAADVAGDGPTRSAAEALSQANLRGQTTRPESGRWSGLTPFLNWLINSGQNERTLVPLVRHTGLIYRQRALRQADWLRVYLPAVLTVVIGGTATLIYALTLFLPYTTLLKDLSHRL